MVENHRFGANGAMTDNASPPNRMALLREAKGWSRPQLAERMGTSAQQVERLEKGQRRLTQDWMERAGRALDVEPAELLRTRNPIDAVDAIMHGTVTPDFPRTVTASRGDGAIALRLLDLDLSMGDGSNLDDYVEEGTIDFDANLLRTITRSPPERLFVARGSGDSMFPTLVNGDMVVIDTLQRTLNLQDRLWAIALFGAGGIKRLQPVGQGKVEVISDNPLRDNRVVDAEDLRILGRVVWVGREV